MAKLTRIVSPWLAFCLLIDPAFAQAMSVLNSPISRRIPSSFSAEAIPPRVAQAFADPELSPLIWSAEGLKPRLGGRDVALLAAGANEPALEAMQEQLNVLAERYSFISSRQIKNTGTILYAAQMVSNDKAFSPQLLKELRYMDNDPDFGFLAVVGIGEFVLLELDPEQKGTLYSPIHDDCHAMSIRAQKGSAVIIGHAHLYSPNLPNRSSALTEFRWVLKQLKTLGLTHIQISLNADSAFSGFPRKKKMLEQLAKEALDLNIQLQFTVRDKATLFLHPVDSSDTNVMVTRDYVALESVEGELRYLHPVGRWSLKSAA